MSQDDSNLELAIDRRTQELLNDDELFEEYRSTHLGAARNGPFFSYCRQEAECQLRANLEITKHDGQESVARA